MPISEAVLKEIREDIFLENKITIDGEDVGDEEVERLTDALRTNTRIKKVSVLETNAGDKSALLLSTLGNVESLFIYDIKITSVGIKALLSSRLKSLTIISSQLGDEGWEEIENNETLEHLDVGCNSITSKGANLIAKSKTINSLNFLQNRLDDECTPYLARMPSLRNLILTTNRITNVGARILKASKIKDICLAQNLITRESEPVQNPILIAYERREKLERDRFCEQLALEHQIKSEAEEHALENDFGISSGDFDAFERKRKLEAGNNPCLAAASSDPSKEDDNHDDKRSKYK
jgi:Leucine-rich repeat (LRR) protein